MKKTLGIVLVAFAIFYLFTQPHHAANAVHDGFSSIGSFVSTLFN